MASPRLPALAAAAVCIALFGAPAVNAQTAQKVSMATTDKAYRVDGARHIYAAYPERIYKGKLPPLVHAIVVAEIDVDANGNVRSVNMIRVPTHAPDVTEKVRQMISQVSPLPAPRRLGGAKYFDVWLVDKSGRFQLDTLTEGQL
jgi:periplasmic protein TonB